MGLRCTIVTGPAVRWESIAGLGSGTISRLPSTSLENLSAWMPTRLRCPNRDQRGISDLSPVLPKPIGITT